MTQDKLLQKETILVIDDTQINLTLLTKMLSNQGYKIRVAPSGMLALKSVQLNPPDLILLDISMPEMDGFSVCENLKANKITRDIPVIFLTASDEVLDKVKAFNLGGVDYITKPFNSVEVLARIENQLRLRQLQLELIEKHVRLEQEIKQRQQVEYELKKANLELEKQVNLDGLTQVFNRRQFNQSITQEWRRALREKQPLSLILCDVDFFKLYNDTYGHLMGDDCLRAVAKAISDCVKRAGDLVARYGGEEFAVILPNTNGEGAVHIAETIREQIHKFQIPHVKSPISETVTLSLGVACVVPTQELSPETLIKTADQALYQAKKQGRDRFVAV